MSVAAAARVKIDNLKGFAYAADPSFSKGLIGINRGDGSGSVNLQFLIFFHFFFHFSAAKPSNYNLTPPLSSKI